MLLPALWLSGSLNRVVPKVKEGKRVKSKETVESVDSGEDTPPGTYIGEKLTCEKLRRSLVCNISPSSPVGIISETVGSYTDEAGNKVTLDHITHL